MKEETNMLDETFGQRLSRIRKEKGLTQEDIAKRIVISPQAVSKWENDVSSPDILVLSSLADILGVSVDELLGRENAPHEEKAEERKAERETVESEVVDDDKTYKAKDDDDDTTTVHFDDGHTHVSFSGGIHVNDGEDEVHIDKHGIYVKEKGKEKVNIGGVRVNVNPVKDKEFWITQGSLFGLAAIAYILMGLLWTDQVMGWKMGWIVFLLPPVIWSAYRAIARRRFTEFAYPVAITAAYLTLGFLGDYLGFVGWGFYWFLFITIPVYYMIFGPIDHNLHRNEIIIETHGRDDDDDDDDD